MGQILHVIPTDDYVEHAQHGTRCICSPKAEPVDGSLIIIHNAWDGRELYERAEVEENERAALAEGTLGPYADADVEFCSKALQHELSRYD